MPRISIEAEGKFIHCLPLQLPAVLQSLRGLGEKQPVLDGDYGVLSAASDSAARLLALAVEANGALTGQATSNFGTLLRVSKVRDALQGKSVRQIPLERVLQRVARAADAKRHLTSALISEAEQMAAG